MKEDIGDREVLGKMIVWMEDLIDVKPTRTKRNVSKGELSYSELENEGI